MADLEVNLDNSDIQGFALRGYNFPLARYLLLELPGPKTGREFVGQIIPHITTGQPWETKPPSTVNIAFTHKGLAQLGLPSPTLLSFPVEFQQGMKARRDILCDTGRNAPERWDRVWREDRVHVWLGVNALDRDALDRCCADLRKVMDQTGGAKFLQAQDAKAVTIDGKVTTKEHFGYTDGFGNPDFEGASRSSQPGQGKLTKDGRWVPLATGEFLLGYADEAGELPVAPVPHLLARNGAFMVYRKLHENVATFRAYLEEMGRQYAGGKEKLAAKIVGRWRDGTPYRTFARCARSGIDRRSRPQYQFHFRTGRQRDSLPHGRPRPPCQSTRRLRLPWRTCQSPAHRAARPALWRLRPGRTTGSGRGRPRRDFHGAQFQHLPPV